MGVAPTHITMHRFGNEVDTSVRRPQISLTKRGLVIYIPPVRSLWYGLRRQFWIGYAKLRLAFNPLPVPLVLIVTGGIIAYAANAEPHSWIRNNSISRLMWRLDAYNPMRKTLSTKVRLSVVGSIFSTGILWGITAGQRFLLRRLLAYHHWMYERKEKSLATKVWAFLLKYVFVRRATNDLHAFQGSLPTLPLPRIEDTVAKYLHTMLPILNDEEMAEMSSLAKDFLRQEGPTLQWYLRLKWLISPNYVSDWWLNYVYLRGREPIAINSNWAGVMYAKFCATNNRCAHAAVSIHEFLVCRQQLIKDNFAPQMIAEVVPLCMDQYERMFATTRIPGVDQDELQTADLSESRHIVILHKGHFYRVQVYSSNTNRILRPAELYPVLESIVNADEPVDEHELLMPALTCIDRTTWAKVREEEFLSNPVNRSSLECIERAAFLMVFEDDEAPPTLLDEVRSLLIGNGHNRWADKSFTLVVQKDGRIGVHVEHAWADASTVGHLVEKVSIADEDRRFYNDDGSLIITEKDERKMQKIQPAEKLKFQLSKSCCKEIEKAHSIYAEARADLDMYILRFGEYGKGMAKRAKCSPDAWIQMALQLAYFRNQGRFDQTYESSTTRLFNLGRTETIRSASVESAAFVKSMLDSNATNKTRLDLLRKACEAHQLYTYDCMTGKGVDRHLFALYVVSAGKGINSPFLKKALSRKWKLSTSQVPTRQLSMKEHVGDQSKLETSNGAFGPVADDGYGVLYAIWMEDLFYFTVTAKKSCPKTDAEKFAGCIKQALLDLAALLPADAPQTKDDKASKKEKQK